MYSEMEKKLGGKEPWEETLHLGLGQVYALASGLVPTKIILWGQKTGLGFSTQVYTCVHLLLSGGVLPDFLHPVRVLRILWAS